MSYRPPYTIPAKPANASAIIAAVINVMGNPLNDLGISARSVLARTPANNTIANKNPTPVATETAKVVIKL